MALGTLKAWNKAPDSSTENINSGPGHSVEVQQLWKQTSTSSIVADKGVKALGEARYWESRMMGDKQQSKLESVCET